MIQDPAPSIRAVAELIGILVSSFTAVEFGRLHYRQLELEKVQALKRVVGHYNKTFYLCWMRKPKFNGGLITLIRRYGILSMGKLLSYLLRMRQTRAGELCLMHYRVKGLNNVQGVDGHWRRNLSISTDYNLKQVFWDFNRSVQIFPMRISKCI